MYHQVFHLSRLSHILRLPGWPPEASEFETTVLRKLCSAIKLLYLQASKSKVFSFSPPRYLSPIPLSKTQLKFYLFHKAYNEKLREFRVISPSYQFPWPSMIASLSQNILHEFPLLFKSPGPNIMVWAQVYILYLLPKTYIKTCI